MKRKISRSKVRKIVLMENLQIQKKSLIKEKRKYKARKTMLTKIEKYMLYESRGMLNEFSIGGMFDSAKGMVGDFFKAGGDSIKQYLIGKVLGFLGLEQEGVLYDILENSLENVEFSDLTGLMTGSTSKEDLVEDLIQGIIEGFVEYGMGEFHDKMKDVPVLSSVIPNKEEMLGAIGVEALANKVSDYLTPKIMPVIEKMLDGFSLTSLIGGGDPDAASFGGDKSLGGIKNAAEKLKALAEVYHVAAKRSEEKINRHNKQIRLIKSIL